MSAAGEHQVVRVDDPRCAELEQAGWMWVAESWGARLRVGSESDLDRARTALAAAPAGIDLRELDPEAAESVLQLDDATRADYPVTPQNLPEVRGIDDVRQLWARGGRVFGAWQADRLVGVTVVDRDGEHAETDFTAVAMEVRRIGVATALKAFSVLTLAAEGVRVFGTGGAAVNRASIRMNEAVGYVIEERWVSLAPPLG